MTNKIFLNNFPLATKQISAVDSNSKKISIITGFDIPLTVFEIRKQVVQSVFNCLLAHEKISISAVNLVYIVDSFGFSDTIELLKQDYFELLDDKGAIFSVLKNNSQKKYETGTVFQDNAISWLERRLPEYKPNSNQLNLTLLQAEEKLVKIDADKISKQVLDETAYDLKNKNLTDHLVIKSKDKDHVEINDILKILRLLRINSGLVYASHINTDNLFVDGAIKSILNSKLSPIVKDNTKDSIGLINDINLKKAIPDLSELYLKKIISIQDFISIIENSNGTKFRKWLASQEYSQDAVIRELLKERPNFDTALVKGIKFIITNAVGLINPVLGLSVSAVESFILNRFLNGWHPNLFLDNTLKTQIDKKIEEDLKSRRSENIKNRFPKVGRNDPCPCGKPKKFKLCCGKS
ncbi:MAG TPA: hypothetical protein VIU35_06330 [Chitinophagaceae bacterium]